MQGNGKTSKLFEEGNCTRSEYDFIFGGIKILSLGNLHDEWQKHMKRYELVVYKMVHAPRIVFLGGKENLGRTSFTVFNTFYSSQ